MYVVCPLILVKVSLNDCQLKSVASIQTKLGNNDQWVGLRVIGVKGHAGVIWGHLEVNCHRNVLVLKVFVNFRSFPFLCINFVHTWYKWSLGNTTCVDEDGEVKGHLGVKRSSDMRPCVTCSHFFSSASLVFTLGTNDPRVIPHVCWWGWWGQRSSRGQKVKWYEIIFNLLSLTCLCINCVHTWCKWSLGNTTCVLMRMMRSKVV